jgi:hypothetical protein
LAVCSRSPTSATYTTSRNCCSSNSSVHARTLALIAEVVHGVPCRFSDPARFSFAHGGKDGHPFPVPLKTYDESLTFLRTSPDRAAVGDRAKLDGFRRLERFARAVETRLEPEAAFDAVMAHEHAISPSINGRTVMGRSSDKPKFK